MSHSKEVWRYESDPELLAYDRAHLDDYSFWQHVDSRPSATGSYRTGSHKGSWEAERAEWCLALNSQRDRCGQQSLGVVPFCAFHFDRAWERIEAFVGEERMARVNRMLELDRRRMYGAMQIDAEMVRDARRALSVQAERVYFYAAEHAVKIGRSIHPERRVRTLGSTKAPTDVDVASGELIGTIPGSANVESALHRRFRRHHLVGEWFELEPIREDLEALIADYAAQESAA